MRSLLLQCMSAYAFMSQYRFWTVAIGRVVNASESYGSVAACMIVYIYDRMVPNTEDKVNKSELAKLNRSSFAMCTLCVCIAVFMSSAYNAPHLFTNAIIAFPFGIAYSIEMRGFRVKTLFPCSKNVFVAMLWTVWFFGACNAFPPQNTKSACLQGIYFMQMILSSIVGDVKDIKGDTAAGIVTIPTLMRTQAASKRFICVYAAILSLMGWSVVGMRLALSYLLFSLVVVVVDLRQGMQTAISIVCLMSFPLLLTDYVPLL